MKTPILPLIGLVTLLAISLVQCAYGQFLPPEEFDKPFNGRVFIHEVQRQDEVRAACPDMQFTLGIALGCSRKFLNWNACAITKVPDDQIRAAGYDPEVVMRHEVGHCNGWGADHKGAR